jgi:predicted dehydrogenase
MIRTAIVGCGKIADSHAEQVKRIAGAAIVGVCDREYLMAAQFGDRYRVNAVFTDVNELIDGTRPDVIHITTPPQSHYSLAKTCLESGCHVYVEKPFTVNTKEAVDLISLANALHLKLTVGHDAQFSHAGRKMRDLVRSGYLGGPPIHIESYYCYGFSGDAYGSALLGDRNHWVRQLPGKLLQNVISHGIASIAEFMVGDAPEVVAIGFTSAFLETIGADDIVDELRVIVRDPSGPTAYFTFSSQMHPCLHQFRMYGPKNGLIVDDDQQTVIQLSGHNYKSYTEKFVPPVLLARQYLGNALRNVKKFMESDFHMKSGMKCLIETFNSSIENYAPLPISYKEIVLTSTIMDSIVEQLSRNNLSSVAMQPVASTAGH